MRLLNRFLSECGLKVRALTCEETDGVGSVLRVNVNLIAPGKVANKSTQFFTNLSLVILESSLTQS